MAVNDASDWEWEPIKFLNDYGDVLEWRAHGPRGRIIVDTVTKVVIHGYEAEIANLRAQVDLLWGRAQRVLNKSNSADDTFEQVPTSTLRDLGAALDATAGKATDRPYEMNPGRKGTDT